MLRFDIVEDCARLAIKTLLWNAIPIAWLFVWQPMVGVSADGLWFWLIYGLFSVVLSALLWMAYRTTPDPECSEASEVATPMRGAVAVLCQVVVFVAVMCSYVLLKTVMKNG